MADKIDEFTDRLRDKLHAIDNRLKDIAAKVAGAPEKARTDIQAQLVALEVRAKEQQAKLEADQAHVKAWLDQKKAATNTQVAHWRAEYNAAKLSSWADAAERYATAAADNAAYAVDEAERAAVEAHLARMDADSAKRGIK